MEHETCQEALSELFTFLDGELDGPSRTAIETHLRKCAPCLEAFDFEAELHKVIADKCRERVPDELRQRIAQALADLEESSSGR